MIYILIAVLSLGFTSGYALGYKLSHASIAPLETALERKNNEAKAVFASRMDCKNAVLNGISPGIAKREADFAAYAEIINRFVQEKANQCDLAANYAVACWAFVNANCGVKN
jgi:hypothetical protein